MISGTQDDYIPWDAIDICVRGTPLLKFGRKGDPHFRQFQLTPDCETLVWASQKKSILDSQVLLKNCMVVEGQQTDVFKRQLRPDLDEVSFSVVYDDPKRRGHSRTLDVACKDRREHDVWVTALQFLIRTKPTPEQIQYRRENYWGVLPSPSTQVEVASSQQITQNLQKQIQDSNDVFAWGRGAWGELGMGDGLPRLVPSLLAPLLGRLIKKVSCGRNHCIALAEGGEAFAWGAGMGGKLGTGGSDHGLVPRIITVPVSSDSLPGKALGGAYTHSIGGSTLNTNLSMFGSKNSSSFNNTFQMGSVATREVIRFRDVSCGEDHSLAIGINGFPYAWGFGQIGSLGSCTRIDHLSPQRITAFVGVSRASVVDLEKARPKRGQERLAFFDLTVEVNPTVVSIAAGSSLSGFIDAQGRLFTCGAKDSPLGHDVADVAALVEKAAKEGLSAKPHSQILESFGWKTQATTIKTSADSDTLDGLPISRTRDSNLESQSVKELELMNSTISAKVMRVLQGYAPVGASINAGDLLVPLQVFEFSEFAHFDYNTFVQSQLNSNSTNKNYIANQSGFSHFSASNSYGSQPQVGSRSFPHSGSINIGSLNQLATSTTSNSPSSTPNLGNPLSTASSQQEDLSSLSSTMTAKPPSSVYFEKFEIEWPRVRSMVCGDLHVAVITDKGRLYTWGYGGTGSLGCGDLLDRRRPTIVSALQGWCESVACGAAHTLAIVRPRSHYLYSSPAAANTLGGTSVGTNSNGTSQDKCRFYRKSQLWGWGDTTHAQIPLPMGLVNTNQTAMGSTKSTKSNSNISLVNGRFITSPIRIPLTAVKLREDGDGGMQIVHATDFSGAFTSSSISPSGGISTNTQEIKSLASATVNSDNAVNGGMVISGPFGPVRSSNASISTFSKISASTITNVTNSSIADLSAPRADLGLSVPEPSLSPLPGAGLSDREITLGASVFAAEAEPLAVAAGAFHSIVLTNCGPYASGIRSSGELGLNAASIEALKAANWVGPVHAPAVEAAAARELSEHRFMMSTQRESVRLPPSSIISNSNYSNNYGNISKASHTSQTFMNGVATSSTNSISNSGGGGGRFESSLTITPSITPSGASFPLSSVPAFPSSMMMQSSSSPTSTPSETAPLQEPQPQLTVTKSKFRNALRGAFGRSEPTVSNAQPPRAPGVKDKDVSKEVSTRPGFVAPSRAPIVSISSVLSQDDDASGVSGASELQISKVAFYNSNASFETSQHLVPGEEHLDPADSTETEIDSTLRTPVKLSIHAPSESPELVEPPGESEGVGSSTLIVHSISESSNFNESNLLLATPQAQLNLSLSQSQLQTPSTVPHAESVADATPIAPVSSTTNSGGLRGRLRGASISSMFSRPFLSSETPREREPSESAIGSPESVPVDSELDLRVYYPNGAGSSTTAATGTPSNVDSAVEDLRPRSISHAHLFSRPRRVVSFESSSAVDVTPSNLSGRGRSGSISSVAGGATSSLSLNRGRKQSMPSGAGGVDAETEAFSSEVFGSDEELDVGVPSNTTSTTYVAADRVEFSESRRRDHIVTEFFRRGSVLDPVSDGDDDITVCSVDSEADDQVGSRSSSLRTKTRDFSLSSLSYNTSLSRKKSQHGGNEEEDFASAADAALESLGISSPGDGSAKSPTAARLNTSDVPADANKNIRNELENDEWTTLDRYFDLDITHSEPAPSYSSAHVAQSKSFISPETQSSSSASDNIQMKENTKNTKTPKLSPLDTALTNSTVPKLKDNLNYSLLSQSGFAVTPTVVSSTVVQKSAQMSGVSNSSSSNYNGILTAFSSSSSPLPSVSMAPSGSNSNIPLGLYSFSPLMLVDPTIAAAAVKLSQEVLTAMLKVNTGPSAGGASAEAAATAVTVTSTKGLGFVPIYLLLRKNVRSVSCGVGFTVATVATEWLRNEDADACVRCHFVFTVTRRRHHCRQCGGVFCDSCSSRRIPLLKRGYIMPVRVCEGCYLLQTTE